jgi:hypothetical protein
MTKQILAISALASAALAAWFTAPRAPPQTALGPPPTLSVIQAGNEPATVQAAPQRPAPMAQQPAERRMAETIVAAAAASGRKLDAPYRKLVAAHSPDAYAIVMPCLRESAVATGPYRVNVPVSMCPLEQGTWQDRALRKEAVAAYALAGRFGAVDALEDEAPGASNGAFTDDPDAYQKVLAEATRIGLERNEPTSLVRASGEMQRRGDELMAHGQAGEARSAYMEALAMQVAAYAGLASYSAQLAVGTSVKVKPYDPDADPVVEAYKRLLPNEDDRRAAINNGLERAKQWRNG